MLGLVLLLWWWLRPTARPPASRAVRTEIASGTPDLTPQPSRVFESLHPVSESPHPVSPAERDPSEVAYRTLQDAFKKLIAARSYRSTMTFLYPDGKVSSQTVIEHWRDAANQEYFRSEEIYSDPRTRQLAPASARITLVNHDGAWVVYPGGKLPDVSFQVQNDADPAGSGTVHRSFRDYTTQPYSPGINYSVASVSRNGRPVTAVTSTAPSGIVIDHFIDAQTGNLLEMSMRAQLSWSVRYEMNIAFPPDRFSIPPDSLVVPTADAGNDAAALSESLRRIPTQSP